MNQLRACWLHGKMHLLPAQDKLFYTACGLCNKSLKGVEGWKLSCKLCRCRIGVLINDPIRTIEAMMFSPITEAMICFTATELRDACLKVIRYYLAQLLPIGLPTSLTILYA